MLAGAVVSGTLGAALLAGAIVSGTAVSEGQTAQAPVTHPAPAAHPTSAARATSEPGPSAASVAADPCTGRTARTIVVSVRTQHLWACDRSRAVIETPVTTGAAGDDTPAGRFTVGAKAADTVLRPETGDTYPVDWWVPFVGDEYGFHDSPWQSVPYGSAQYRTGGSHGCVHVPAAAMKRLFAWARPGTSVVIA